MKVKVKCVRIAVLLITYLLSLPSQALDAKLALLHGDAKVFSYEISVIKLALKYSGEPYKLTLVDESKADQARILRQLNKPNGEINFFFSGYSPEREKTLLQVDFPLSRGLLGYRIFITNKKNLPLFKSIQTLQQMKSLITVGSGTGWPDTTIFKRNGFQVISANYESLWKMLNANRFIGFNRGVDEAYTEIVKRRKTFPQFVVDPYLMVIYHYDYFIYVSPRHRDLYNALRKGIIAAYKSGAFQENFNKQPQIKAMLTQLKPAKRKIFHLKNPLLSPRIKALPDNYWIKLDQLRAP